MQAATNRVDESLTRFEAALASRASDPGEAARRALSEAVAARDLLESVRPTPALVLARGEEMIYVNHLIAAFRDFLSRPPDAASIETVRSIVRRGRAHQARARESLRVAGTAD